MPLTFLIPFLVITQAEALPVYKPAAETKAAFLKQLDRPRIPIDARVDKISEPNAGLVTELLSFASEKKADGTIERVPALIVRPADNTKARPAVVVLHGTGGSKLDQTSTLEDLARLGFVAISIDGRYHGERNSGKGTDDYNNAITRAWRTKPGEPSEHPFYFDTCWDIWRTLDFLETRSDVDANRIGMIGFSKGGIETWMAASVDDRVKVAVPAISVQSFAWGLENNAWQGRANTISAAHAAAASDLGESGVNAKVCRALWDKVIPGVTGDFDCPSLLRLFAGRPLLILNGSEDPNCPIGGAKVAFASARSAYEAAGVPNTLEINVAQGVGHAVTPAQRKDAYDWFVLWLKP
jgi:dienelactone hydrolase